MISPIVAIVAATRAPVALVVFPLYPVLCEVVMSLFMPTPDVLGTGHVPDPQWPVLIGVVVIAALAVRCVVWL